MAQQNDTARNKGLYKGYDHITFWVGNAKQAASFYVTRFGFTTVAYQGLETQHRTHCKYVVRSGAITWVFVSPLTPSNGGDEVSKFLALHGDAVKDVAFAVVDAKSIYQKAVQAGAVSVQEPMVLEDQQGQVTLATIKTYGDVTHTFIQRAGYEGPFLPHFVEVPTSDPTVSFLPKVPILYIDHVVGNQPANEMETIVKQYEKHLKFHRFWSVDSSILHTEYSALNSVVVSDPDDIIKMPVNEPAAGLKKSQIQEYVDYHGSAGVQHIALRTNDIIRSVSSLRDRGVEFLSIPSTYYAQLKESLSTSPTKVAEPLQKLQDLQILVDFDEKGYLLQIFTKPVGVRPTLFLEIIQRQNHNGFGAGNFKALFEAIEKEQAARFNL